MAKWLPTDTPTLFNFDEAMNLILVPIGTPYVEIRFRNGDRLRYSTNSGEDAKSLYQYLIEQSEGKLELPVQFEADWNFYSG